MDVTRHVLRPGFGLGWIAANTAGYALAFAVWEAVSQPIWPALSGFLGGSLTVALYGAALGVGASLAQTLVLRPSRRPGRSVDRSHHCRLRARLCRGRLGRAGREPEQRHKLRRRHGDKCKQPARERPRSGDHRQHPLRSRDRQQCGSGALADPARVERSGRPLDPGQRRGVHAGPWHSSGAHPVRARTAGGDLWRVVRRMRRRDHGAHRVAVAPTAGGGMGSGYVSVRSV